MTKSVKYIPSTKSRTMGLTRKLVREPLRKQKKDYRPFSFAMWRLFCIPRKRTDGGKSRFTSIQGEERERERTVIRFFSETSREVVKKSYLCDRV